MEETEVITQTDSVARKIQGCKGIEETSCETAKTTVSKRWLRLNFLDFTQGFSGICEGSANLIIETEVDQVVGQQFSNQELCTDVVELASGYRSRFLFAVFADNIEESEIDLLVRAVGK